MKIKKIRKKMNESFVQSISRKFLWNQFQEMFRKINLFFERSDYMGILIMTMIKICLFLKKERKTENTNKKFILYYNSISVSSMKLLCDDDFFLLYVLLLSPSLFFLTVFLFFKKKNAITILYLVLDDTW